MIKNLCLSQELDVLFYKKLNTRLTIGFLIVSLITMSATANSLNNNNIVFGDDNYDTVLQSIIKGKVTDKEGSPLPGVNIIIKGTNKGVDTDFNGNYSIEANNGDVLIFSYVGMKQVNITVGNSNTINITLEEDANALDEVVVIGYGTKSKATIAGAVEVVNSDVLESKAAPTAMSAIQGVIPGVTITRSNGQPGAGGFNINIRGLSSVNGGNSPLILIDGNPSEDLDILNPHDIENISVLKDAAAAIYGSRAAGGVILITTKSGRKGKQVVKFSTNTAFSKPLNKVKYPTLLQYAHMNQEADIANGVAPFWDDARIQKIIDGADPDRFGSSRDFQFYKGIDMFEELYGTGFRQDYNLSISGGSDKSNYYFSLGYNKDDGMIDQAPDQAERFNIRMNYSYKILDNLNLNAKLSYDRLKTKEIYNLGRALNGLATYPLFFPVKTPEGNWFSQWGYANPITLARAGDPREKWTNRVSPNFKLDWDILEDLTLTGQASLTFENYNSRLIKKQIPYYFWEDIFSYYEYQTNPSNANYGFSKTNQRNYSLTLKYDHIFNDVHNVSVMVGAVHEESDYDWFSAYRDNFISDELFSLNLGSTDNMSNGGGGNHWALESLISRIGYIYKDKYIFEANLRYDGSSRFAEEQRWKLFKGASAAWRLSEEDFIKNTGWFDNLKLRMSYGELGNQAGIGLYDYVQNINIGGQYPFGDTQKAQSASLAGMVSRERTWETLISRNIGVDMTVLDNRLDLSYDYYYKTNKNMLLGVTLPSVLGAAPPAGNNGELDSWGWELSAGWKDQIKDFKYGARVVLSNSDNKVVDLGGYDNYGVGYNWVREGYRANLYYGYVFDGIIQDQVTLDEYKTLGGVPGNIGIGDAMYKDVDGNGRIDAYSDERENGDLAILGTSDPQYNFGINLNAEYKGFDLTAFFQGVGKRSVFREGTARVPFHQPWYHPTALYYNNTWAPDRTDAKYPRLSHSNIRYWNYQHSSNNEENGAYIRMKNIQLGYTLPESIVDSMSLSKVRVYFSGNDLWDYHKMGGGYDPEDNSYGDNYAFAKTVSFGVDITF
ncbi:MULTISPECIES: SusC/RagA family TonB-linked outer membrane protein [Flavobacteriaceae]|uniref:TonB-dependent receptor n=2 Tax=Flavobacteriaceae TaxID=49546 RepID=A0A4Y8AVZ4_9FLAO|nr:MULTISPECIES: TonB-dependent receptor [Flavobacteriaceae]TEW75550.1 TonB-dependent receptor [Gramella jeungdoensis]GGK46115.1 SusC/RagA family TonB-linked outer membrane protein [Lutibacter litoralis]